jgi:nitrogen fixation protein FixH
MKRFYVCTIFLVLAACGGKTASSNLAITTTFAPSPPKQGPETIIVSLKDVNGKPVTGASVKITSTMPSMAMQGPSIVAKDAGDGTYSAAMILQYATDWTFDINAAIAGEAVTAEVKQSVK